MKSTLLLIISVLVSHLCLAQNWQCLQPGSKCFFTNNSGYLRGERIDSVRTYADSVVYFPFHTARGRYGSMTGSNVLDANGGSWLGGHVTALADGTTLFDNMWHNPVIIRTQAAAGVFWIFYSDTTSRYYRADLTAIDTMTIAGITDSVKHILITARDTAGIVTTDPADSLELLLSKDHGLLQAIDVYTFPYHAPDSNYAPWLDFYLDCTVPLLFGLPAPSSASAIFTRTNYHYPLRAQVYNFNIGDVFEQSICNINYPGNCIYPYQYAYSSVTGKTVSAGGVQYDYSGWVATQHAPPFAYVPNTNYPYDTLHNAYSLSYDYSSLTDTSLMPEEYRQQQLQYYYPADTTHCTVSAAYAFNENSIRDSVWQYIHFESSGVQTYYKTGFGLTHYYLYTIGNPSEEVEDTTIIYSLTAGSACGTIVTPQLSAVSDVVKASGSLNVFPDPATDKLTITSTGIITRLSVTDLLGRTLMSANCSGASVEVDISMLQPGIYFVRVNGSELRKFVKE